MTGVKQNGKMYEAYVDGKHVGQSSNEKMAAAMVVAYSKPPMPIKTLRGKGIRRNMT